ncbi:PH domain-containing protein [Flagellimonas myxillae]|uniref:PH domain-containing protein n=1 Tax=Flagellimonas myxillae TaxID=2942214 RepID=UPI00201F8BA3|nr:PH domain-containing protein [Muricauda myxillae]MCL6265309.1 PH domain-containing protein [Muricauda myxillae]
MVTESKRYRSKVGPVLLIFILLIYGAATYFLLMDWNWTGGVIHFSVMILTLYLLFSISYEVKGRELLINYAAFYQKKLDISTITHIGESRNPMGSPAASLDRLGISYKGGFVLVSPKDKKGFVDHLTSINPRITIQLKEKE